MVLVQFIRRIMGILIAHLSRKLWISQTAIIELTIFEKAK